LEIIKLVRYYRDIGRNLRDAFSLHTVFVGNPGTGKTTVARLLVQIYKALGILERGQLVECDRKSLVAGFIGQTAIKTAEVIDRAMGGGLFIDEAYSLNRAGGNDYGNEAIETVLKRMEDRRGEFMVIVAGYPKEMEHFLASNPGLKSRFDKHFHFKDYTAKELLTIADNLFASENLYMTTAARAYLLNHLNDLLNKRTKYFGNARTIRKIVTETIRKQHLRLASLAPEKRQTTDNTIIAPKDLQHIKNTDYYGDSKQVGFQILPPNASQ
jgi:SpoVK/Ycf46/Vps4 family AAA+-type ATPase